jgi:hypothetical protein
MIPRWLFVFILAVATEAAYTCYAYYMARGDQVRGPLSAGAIAIGKGILVVNYVAEPLLGIAALTLGQVAGTWLTLRFIKSRGLEKAGGLGEKADVQR